MSSQKNNLSVIIPYSPSPYPVGTTNLLSVSMDLPIMNISYKRSCTICVPFCLAYFTWNVFVVHVSSLRLHSIPLYAYTTFCLSICPLRDSWVISTFWLLRTMLLWKFMYKLLCGYMVSFLLDIYLGVELLGHMVTMFNFLKSYQTLPKWLHHFYIPTSSVWGFQISSHPHQHLLLVGVNWYLIVISRLICISLKAND